MGSKVQLLGALLALSRRPHIDWYIGLLGTALALTFTFLLLPAMTAQHHVILDPDQHGPLGFGLWKLHTFAYFPHADATAARGPVYPVFIAGILAISNGWWPYAVQMAQCGLFGLLCVLVYRVASVLWSPPLPVLAAGLCALDPFLIWYTGRIWVETVLMFLFTSLFATLVLVKVRPTQFSGIAAGIVVGLSALAKSIFVPFLLIAPLSLLLPFGKRTPIGLAMLVLLVGLLVVTPWSIRNGQLTGVYAPEVGSTGFTLHQGNDFVEDFARAPFAISALHPLSLARLLEESEAVTLDPGASDLRKNLALDAVWRRNAVDKLTHSPRLLVKKLAYNSVLFWTLGDSPGKSAAISLCQVPVVVLFGAFVLMRRELWLHSSAGLAVLLIMLFYISHLPTIALARYSAALVPTMLIAAVGLLESDARQLRMPDVVA
jgi:4-amino-4-deoxy-L-arabinose transferase-like glycosyltransferase